MANLNTIRCQVYSLPSSKLEMPRVPEVLYLLNYEVFKKVYLPARDKTDKIKVELYQTIADDMKNFKPKIKLEICDAIGHQKNKLYF